MVGKAGPIKVPGSARFQDPERSEGEYESKVAPSGTKLAESSLVPCRLFARARQQQVLGGGLQGPFKV